MPIANCPFCGTAPMPFGEKGDYEHPLIEGCFVSGQMIPVSHIRAWETRAETPEVAAARTFRAKVEAAFLDLCEGTGVPATAAAATEYRERARAGTQKMAEAPTDGQLVSACLSYDHGYGLMDPPSRDLIHFRCKEWWRSIARAVNDSRDGS